MGLLVFGLLIFGLAPSARADTTTPMRAAGLTYLQGTVTITQAGNPAGLPAQLNLPLLTGVQVDTGQDGQAEVEFEDGSVVRLTPNSALSLDNLAVDPSGIFSTNLSLVRGLAYLELRATPQYLYSLNAGGDILSPIENTTVRVNFDEAPATFAVLDGTAHVDHQVGPDTGAGFQADVRAGESIRADAADPTRYFLTEQIAGDTWDQWNVDLDQAASAQAADSTSVRNDYAGAEGYGWSDLDADGSWYNVPGQGQIWQPQVAADDSSFDPYGDGAWVLYPGTGYVWASAYPWGWIPYRCGSWSYFNGFGWGWAPAARCGSRGWGFAGGGLVVNIGAVPRGYRPVHVPVAATGPLPVRPVVPVHPIGGTRPPVRSTVAQPGPRQFAGVTATPIKPVASGVVPEPGAAGTALRRDFPIDSATRAPVLGLAATRPAVVHTTEIPRPVAQPSVPSQTPYNGQPRPMTQPSSLAAGPYTGQPRPTERPPAPAAAPYSSQPRPATQPPNPAAAPYGEQPRPAPVVRPAPAPTPRPVQQNAPAQRSAPAPAPRPTYTPPPAAPHPSYSAPPAPHPAPASAPAAGHNPK